MPEVTPALATLGASGWVPSPTFTGIGGRTYGAVAAPPSAPIDPLAIRNPSKIASALAALAGSGSARMNIVVVGHSVPWGVGSDGTSNTTFTAAQTARTASWPSKMAAALVASKGGAVSYGLEHFAAGSSGFFTLGGGLVESSPFGPAGVGGERVNLASAAATSAAVTAVGTAVRFYGYASATGVQPRHQVNGGSIVTGSASTAADPTGHAAGSSWWTYTVTGLTPGDVVTLLAPTAVGSYVMYACDLDYRTDAGITIHRCCYPGQMGVQVFAPGLDNTDLFGPGTTLWTPQAGDNGATLTTKSGNRTAAGDSLSRILGAHLVIFEFDINDLKAYNTASGNNWGYLLADLVRHQTNMVNFCAARSIPCLIVGGPLRDPQTRITDGVPYAQDEVIAAYRGISDASSNCAFYDFTAQYTGATLADRYAAQQASGLIVDTVHPNAAGHIFYGGQLASALLAA